MTWHTKKLTWVQDCCLSRSELPKYTLDTVWDDTVQRMCSEMGRCSGHYSACT